MLLLLLLSFRLLQPVQYFNLRDLLERKTRLFCPSKIIYVRAEKDESVI